MTGHYLAKKFRSYFRLLYADSDELLRQVFKIRYDVFCTELQLEKNCPKDVEKDESDAYAAHFLLQHKRTGQYAGTIRFIIPPPDNNQLILPLEKYCLHAFDRKIIDPSALPRGTFGEVSRLAVPATFRKRAGESGRPYILDNITGKQRKEEKRLFPYISVGLYLTCAALIVHRQLPYTFIMAEPRLVRNMARIGIKFKQAGNVIDYHGQRAPYYTTPKMLINNMKPEIMDLFHYLKEDLIRQLDPIPAYRERLTG